MTDSAAWLRRKFQSQFSHINRDQAIQAGLTPRQIFLFVERGEWLVIHRGVYRDANAPPHPDEHACAALLWCGKGGAISHESAAHLWSIDGFERRPNAVHLSVPKDISRAPKGIELFRRSDIATELALHRGLRLTNLPQTLVDLASRVSDEALEIALDSVHRTHRNIEAQLRAWKGRHGTQGIEGAARLFELLDLRTNRYTDSPFEVLFRRAMREHGFNRFIWGYVARHNGKPIMRIDGADPALMIAIHLDSKRWHDNPSRFRGWSNQILTWEDFLSGKWVARYRALIARRMRALAA
jgi:phage baseplate assembly protein gpV